MFCTVHLGTSTSLLRSDYPTAANAFFPFSPFLTNLSIEKFDREILLSLSLSLYMRKVLVKISSNREKKSLRLVGNAVVNATTLEEQLQRDVEIIDREILRRKNRPKFLSCRFIVRNG